MELLKRLCGDEAHYAIKAYAHAKHLPPHMVEKMLNDNPQEALCDDIAQHGATYRAAGRELFVAPLMGARAM